MTVEDKLPHTIRNGQMDNLPPEKRNPLHRKLARLKKELQHALHRQDRDAVCHIQNEIGRILASLK